MSAAAVNREFVKCWPIAVGEIASQIRAAISKNADIHRPYIDFQLESPPEFRAIPSPTEGGRLEIALPGQGSWGLTLAGSVKAPDGHRSFKVEVRGLRIIAGLNLDAPTGPDPRPRIPGPNAFSSSVSADILVSIEAVGSASLVATPKSGTIFHATGLLEVVSGLPVTVEASISVPDKEGLTKVAVSLLPGVTLTFPFRLPLGPIDALKDGLPRLWPPANVVQPPTPPTGAPASTQAELEILAKGRRQTIVDQQHQIYGVIVDRFVNHAAGRGFVGVCGDEDSAIWTGHLLAADALNDDGEKIDLSLTGIERLFDVPTRFAATNGTLADDPRLRAIFSRDLFEIDGLFARCALPLQESKLVFRPFDDPANFVEDHWVSEDIDPDLGHPKTPSNLANYRTVDMASPTEPDRAHGREDHPPTRDSTMGIVLGLACTLRFASDPALRKRAALLAVRLADRLDRNGWAIVAPKGGLGHPAVNRPGTTRDSLAFFWAMQLATMRLAATADPGRFNDRYFELAMAYADDIWLAPWSDSLDGLGKLFPLNLEHAAYAALMLLETDTGLREKYALVGRFLSAATAHHGNPHFDLLRLLADADSAALAQAPSHPEPYGGAATLEAGLLLSISDVSNRANGFSLPAQSNPTSDEQQYLLAPEVLGNPLLFTQDPEGPRPFFSVPPSRRRGGHLDFAWQRSPFEALNVDHVGAAPDYGPARASVTSPGIDFLLPLAALGRLKRGLPPVPEAQELSVPVRPTPIQLPATLAVNPTTTTALKQFVASIVNLAPRLNALGADPSPATFLDQRLRDLTVGATGQAQLAVFIGGFPQSKVTADELGTLVADAVFLLFGDPRMAEVRLLEAFRPTLRDAWDKARALFGIPISDPLRLERDAEVLAAPVSAVLPGGLAASLAQSLVQSEVFDPLGPSPRIFDDPDLPFGRALRLLLHTENPR